MKLSTRFLEARYAADRFLRGIDMAAEYEQRLLALNFYNVEFSPPAASFDGVRYPLTTSFTELA